MKLCLGNFRSNAGIFFVIIFLQMTENVIIIGAGPAGLTAAMELLKNGGDYDVTILEGSQAMGGISQTVRYNGNRMDIGGHRFFSKNQQVMDWCPGACHRE